MTDPDNARKHAAWATSVFVVVAFIAGCIIGTFYRESAEDLMTSWGVILGGMAATALAYLMGMIGPKVEPPAAPPADGQP